MLLLPGALTVYLSFNAGGYFVGAPALATIALLLVLILRTLLAERPFAGLSGLGLVVGAALALYAVWALLSAFWSDAPARALLEFDRAVLYLVGFLLFASLPCSSRRLAWAVRGLALGIVTVCTIALVTRLAPDIWPIAENIEPDRLSYPLTYWNALGLLAVIGIALSLHLSAHEREPTAVRVLAAAALPALSSTLLLTFSRGAIAVCGGALVAYVVLGRPRGLGSALVAAAPMTVIAVSAAYGADLVSSEEFTRPAAVAQGHDLARVVVLCSLGAGLLRLLLVPVDSRLSRLRMPESVPRAARPAAVGLLLLVGSGALLALGAAGYVERQYDRFVQGEPVRGGVAEERRARLLDPTNNGRLDHWDIALEGFRDRPLLGSGAGTYELLWARHKPGSFTVVDAHSLYVEALGELGIVGAALILLTVAGLLTGIVLRLRGRRRSRPLYAATFAVALAWALHAGIDWDWEMPAVSLGPLALSALVLASGGRRGLAVRPSRSARIVISLALFGLAVTPALAAISQQQLDRSVTAFKRGDCRDSIDAALDSISTLSIRPEPWEVLGYCNARLGRHALAARAFENAIKRDPDSWQLYYGLAVAHGIARRDPLPAARHAQRLNPREPLTRDAVEAFRTRDPATWQRRARKAPVPIG